MTRKRTRTKRNQELRQPRQVQYNVTFLITVRGETDPTYVAELSELIWDMGMSIARINIGPGLREMVSDATGFDVMRVGEVW